MAGGTGFYLHWLIHGKAQTAKSDAEGEKAARDAVAARIARDAAGQGREPSTFTPQERWQSGCKVLEDLDDAESAARMRLTPNNWYRLLRSIQVVQRTGQPMAQTALTATPELDYDFRCFFLKRPKVEMVTAADARVEEMMLNGLLEECALLLREGVTANSHCASRGIGYRQGLAALERWVRDGGGKKKRAMEKERREAPGAGSRVDDHHHEEYLDDVRPRPVTPPDARLPPVGVEDVREVTSEIQSATRQLIRKQEMWFRGYVLFKWVDRAHGVDAALAEVRAGVAAEGGMVGDNAEDFAADKAERDAMRRYQTEWRRLGEQEAVWAVAARAEEIVRGLRGEPGVRALLRLGEEDERGDTDTRRYDP